MGLRSQKAGIFLDTAVATLAPHMANALTLDSNIPLEYWKDQRRKAVVEELLSLRRAGDVSLIVTARIREDIPREPLAAEIDRLPELGISEGPSVTRLDYWVLGRDLLGSDAFVDAQQGIEEGLRGRGHVPPDWRDWDHLHAHYLQGRDVYLTWDKRVVDAGGALRERLGIRVMTPEEYLASRSDASEAAI